MHAVLGYLLCLVALLPAFSLNVFFWLIGRTTRQHDFLGLFRSTLQMMVTVSSPYKIALTVFALLLAFASESPRSTRAVALLLISVVGVVGSLQMLYSGRGGTGAAIVMWPSTFATLAGVSWGARVLTTGASL